jgi:hypothetical protein
MANYYGQARTNYFAVKDAEAFREDIKNYPVELIERKNEETGETLFGFMDASQDGAGLDDFIYDDDFEATEISWEDLFEKHLVDGWVAVILETGAEKYRYLVGCATAYNNKREVKHIDINDFVTHFSGMGDNIAPASY